MLKRSSKPGFSYANNAGAQQSVPPTAAAASSQPVVEIGAVLQRRSTPTNGPAASGGVKVPANVLFDFFVVLDFEATCEEGTRIQNQEIIEFPFVVVSGATLGIVAEFQRYVRPVHNPTLSKFCVGLTGIEQAWVDKANPFAAVFDEAREFLKAGGLVSSSTTAASGSAAATSKASFAIVTCGDWDLKTMLPNQLRLQPNGPSLPDYYHHWINLKTVAKSVAPRNKKIDGMEDMLRLYNLPLVGRHHSGIDDCRNIAAVLVAMLRKGVEVNITTTTSRVPAEKIQPVRTRIPGAPVQASSFPPSSLDHHFGKVAPKVDDVSAAAGAFSSSSVMDEKGRLKVNEERDPKNDIPPPTGAPLAPEVQVSFSKRLTYALRHGAIALHLFMFKNGFAELDELLAHKQFKGLSVPVVAKIVRDCSKQWFRLVYGVDGKMYICANQGHSITGIMSDFKEVKSAADVPTCVHGTNSKAWDIIKSSGGLSPMGRLHIHFAKGTPGADGVISGVPNNAAVLIYIDVGKLLKDGIPLWESANGVYLSPGDHATGLIGLQYFQKVINRKSGKSLPF